MPNSIIYACGDYVKLKSLRQCNGLRNKNPIALAVGVSIGVCMFDNSILRKYYRMHSAYINSCIEYAHYTGGVITGLHEDKERILEVMHLDTLQQQVFPVFYNKTKDFERSISKTYSTVALYRYGAAGITDKLSLVDDLVPEIMDFMPDITPVSYTHLTLPTKA